MEQQHLFGRIALKKQLVTEPQLSRALRLQEEIRAVGLNRPLGRILVETGQLEEQQVDLILRLQAVNQRARDGRRLGAIAVKNKLLSGGQLEAALQAALEEGWQRGLDDLLVARGDLDERRARAIRRAMERADRSAAAGDASSEELPLGEARPRSPTGKLTQALEVDGEGEAAAHARDLIFAAVALREGLVRVPELERAVEEQLVREEPASLADVLVERGVLGPDEVAAIQRAVEASRQERLTIPGYELVEVLGYGVTSLVLEARHALLERDVAIKLFRDDHIAATAQEELLEEARTVAKLRHKNLVELYEVGRVHRRMFYVMELIDGPGTLTDTVRTWGPMAERDALEMARDVTSALQCIHEHGLVHRDVKPQNVLFSKKGLAKLTDLGLARQVGQLDEAPGALYGSPYTMSPEQANGDPVDARADLYGLGATLYYALVGVYPYEGQDTVSILMAHLTAPVPDPREKRADLGPAVADLVQRLLGKQPDERPTSAADVVRAIEGILAFG